MPIPAALVAGIASAAITAAGNIAMSERQRKTNESYQDKMNEYNSPEEQMKRLKDAGISPNAYLTGNGQLVQGNLSAGINPYQVPNLGDPFAQAASSFLTYSQGKTEDKMLPVRMAEAQANIDNLKATFESLGLSNEYQGIINTYAAVQQEMAIKGQEADIQMKYADIAKSKQETKNLLYTLQNVLPAETFKAIQDGRLSVYNIGAVIADIANTKAQTANIEQDTSLKAAETEGQQIENRNAQQIADEYLKQIQQTVAKLKSETQKTDDEIFYMLYDAYDKYLSPSVMGFKLPANLIGWHSNEFEEAVRKRYNTGRPKLGAPSQVVGR